MNRPRSLFAVLMLTACVTPSPEHAAGGAGGVESHPTSQPTHVPRVEWGRASLDAGARLVAQLSDAAHASAPPDPRTDSPAWEAFYDPAAVHTVDIVLEEAAFDALEEDGRAWVPAQVTIDMVQFSGAGVRRKGSTTWQSMYGKPSLKIKLRAFGDGPPLAGLERLTLNNMVSDPAQARENVALQLWRALGVPATRASWAVVSVNGEPYGLYSNIEPLDDAWLRRRYVAPGGDLWEANDDADFTTEGLAAWELSEGTGASGAPEALAAVLEAGVEDFDAEVGPLVNVDPFLRYWAACLVTGAADGYPFHLNDAYVYADPDNGDRLDFLPWGMDEAWADNFSPWTEGRLAEACRDDAACDARRRAVLDDLLDALTRIDVRGLLGAAYATSAPYLADDPRRPYTAAEVEASRLDLATRIEGWPARVRAEAE